MTAASASVTATPIPTANRRRADASDSKGSPPQPVDAVEELNYPTLVDFWDGRARFVLEAEDTGLPLGESDTIVAENGELWSFLHASHPSLGVLDQCGNPVPFPGCTVIYRSTDEGYTFSPGETPHCQFKCVQCPCTSEEDHIEQQQYPRVFFDGETYRLVYEYLGRVMIRHSQDGLTWGPPERIASTGIWKVWLRDCPAAERIGEHPFVPYDYECLAGGPPGIFVNDRVYVFLAVGQSPGGMGCYVGDRGSPGDSFRRCKNNPLFLGANSYGPDERGPVTNPHFDFRMISAADVHALGQGSETRYYMLFEGIRGPGRGDPGDTQFGLGLARSQTAAIDGPWETYPGNPILVDLPGNIGVGHGDLVVAAGKTILYTSLDGRQRSRLGLKWIEAAEAR